MKNLFFNFTNEEAVRGWFRVQVVRAFASDSDRYYFDFELCTRDKGWTQFDTDQDAWYFGVWVHRQNLCVLTYAEGDVSIEGYPDRASFESAIDAMCSFYGQPPPAFTVVDADGAVTEHYDPECRLGREVLP